MRTVRCLILAFVGLLAMNFQAKAQSANPGPDVGGLWCIVDVNTETDDMGTGWGYYTLDAPLPNGAYFNSNSMAFGRMGCGPGRPWIYEENGQLKLKLWLDGVKLDLMDATEGIEYIEVFTDKYVTGLAGSMQMYVTIQLVVKTQCEY